MNDVIRGSLYSEEAVLRSAFVAGELLTGAPCLIDWELLKLAGRVVGPIGSGKTVFLRSLVRQLCMRQSPAFVEYGRRKGWKHEPISIVYITFVKSDDRERNFMAECARMAGMKLKVFDPTPGGRTHVYNPWLQKFVKRMSKADIGEYQTQAGDMHGDEEYGPKYHGGKDLRLVTSSILAHGHFKSYWHQYRYIANENNDGAMGLSKQDRRAGDQVVDHFQILSTVAPFNEYRRKNGPPETAIANAIDFTLPFEEPQLVYMNLDWLGAKRKHTLAKHALFDCQQAAKVLGRKGRTHRVFFVVDEAQELVSSQAVVALFDQIRHRDISLILAHQYDAQAKRRGPDYLAGLDVNASWKIDFSLPTPEAMERAQKYAPDDLRPSLSFPLAPQTFFDRDEEDAISLARSMAAGYVPTASEKWEPRYTKNMIIGMNRTGRVGWLRARFDSGSTRVNGIEPFIWRHSMSAEQWAAYETDERLVYTPPEDETVEVPLEPDFPENDDAADDGSDAASRAINDKLREIGGGL